MAMTRDEVLAAYRPVRLGIQRVLAVASNACKQADFARAFKHVAPWAEADEIAELGGGDMIMDVALFEPNQRGRRVIDRFLAEKPGQALPPPDRALAERIATAWFSIFRVTGRHDAAGLWLEDLLDGNRRVWVMDEAMERSASTGMTVAMRLFDAGTFHAGFGVIVQPEEETVAVCVASVAHGGRIPFRHSLAATLYGDALRDAAGPGEEEAITLLQALLELADTIPPRRKPAARRAKRQRSPR